jgi:hypothetical protein
MANPLDMLIIGSQCSCTRSLSRVRQVPFSFEGLAEAYRLLPEVNTLIIVPDAVINRTMPTAAVINSFKYPQVLHPIVIELGLLIPGSLDPVPSQVEQSLAAIQEDERPAFIRRAARAAIAHILDRIFPIVNSGGTVFLLIPEDLPSWPAEDAEFLRSTMSGIWVAKDDVWATRLQGEYAGMVENAGSFLRFDLSNDYHQLLDEEGYMDVPDALPHPEQVLSMLPPDIQVSMVPGAVDRVGQCRVLTFRWGTGQFILAPARSQDTLLTQLLAAETPEDVVEPACGIPDRLSAMLPADPSELNQWTQAVGWEREDRRRGAVHSLQELADTLDGIPQGTKPATEKVPVRRSTGEIDSQHTTGEALRKLLKRIRKKKPLPPGLSAFLAAAEAKWKACFRNT